MRSWCSAIVAQELIMSAMDNKVDNFLKALQDSYQNFPQSVLGGDSQEDEASLVGDFLADWKRLVFSIKRVLSSNRCFRRLLESEGGKKALDFDAVNTPKPGYGALLVIVDLSRPGLDASEDQEAELMRSLLYQFILNQCLEAAYQRADSPQLRVTPNTTIICNEVLDTFGKEGTGRDKTDSPHKSDCIDLMTKYLRSVRFYGIACLLELQDVGLLSTHIMNNINTTITACGSGLSGSGREYAFTVRSPGLEVSTFVPYLSSRRDTRSMDSLPRPTPGKKARTI
jgi:hypothetical protein